MIRLHWAILLLVACVSCENNAMTFPDGKLRYLALGDSYTIGEAVEPGQRWPVQLAERLRSRGVMIGNVQIVAATGWSAAELSAGIDDQQPRGGFDLVTLLIGVNDQYRGGDAEAFRPELAALLGRAIDFAGGDAGKVVLVSIPDWGVMPFATGRDRNQIAGQIDAFNAVCQSTAAARQILFVDVTEVSRTASTQPGLVADDGLHPSGAQYALWAKQIDEAMQRRSMGE